MRPHRTPVIEDSCHLLPLSPFFLVSVLNSLLFPLLFFSLPCSGHQVVQQCVPCGTYSYYSTNYKTIFGGMWWYVCVCVCVCVCSSHTDSL